MTRPLFIASDHGGVQLKDLLSHWLPSLLDQSYILTDLGTHTSDAVDYPDIVNMLVQQMRTCKNDHPLGILICGSGIGVSIAANRHPSIRAALVNEPVTAALSRAHNNANVICFGARLLGTDMAKECIKAFLTTPFEGGRHEKRVQKLSTTPSL